MKSRAKQIVEGFLLGVLPYAFVFIVLALSVPGGHGPAPGFAMAFAMVFPILIVGILVFTLLCQSLTSLFLFKRGFDSAAKAVWLVYPTVFLPCAVWFGYHDFRVKQAAQEDYSSRVLIAPSKEVRNVLLVERQSSADLDSGDFQRPCDQLCTSILKTGVLDSLAVPTDKGGGGFIIYRFDRGEACVQAERNYREFSRVETGYRRTKQIEDRYIEGLKKIKSKTVGTTNQLENKGYFDECITYAFRENYDPDIKINFGPAFKRAYGPCCQIAEVYEDSGDSPRLLGRWEASTRNAASGETFELEHVIAKLTGKAVQPQLPPYPFGNAATELARLASLPARAIHDLHFSDAPSRTTTWIKKVFQSEAVRTGKTVSLSDGSIEHLLRLAPVGDAYTRAMFFRDISKSLDASSRERLRWAEDEYQRSKG